MLIYDTKIGKFLKNLFAIFFSYANKVVTYKQNTNMIIPSVIYSAFVRKLLARVFIYFTSLAITRIVVISRDNDKDEVK